MRENKGTTTAVVLSAVLHLGIVGFLALAIVPCSFYESLFATLHLPAEWNPISCAKPLELQGPVIEATLIGPTGAPPPNTSFWPEIAAQDPFMKLLKDAVLDSPDKVRGAYYFPQWPAVHKAFNDTVTKAVTGKREDIAKVLAEGAPLVSKAAQ